MTHYVIRVVGHLSDDLLTAFPTLPAEWVFREVTQLPLVFQKESVSLAAYGPIRNQISADRLTLPTLPHLRKFLSNFSCILLALLSFQLGVGFMSYCC